MNSLLIHVHGKASLLSRGATDSQAWKTHPSLIKDKKKTSGRMKLREILKKVEL